MYFRLLIGRYESGVSAGHRQISQLGRHAVASSDAMQEFRPAWSMSEVGSVAANENAACPSGGAICPRLTGNRVDESHKSLAVTHSHGQFVAPVDARK